MINAKELRIGNKVMMSTDGGEEYFLTTVDVGDFMDINARYKLVKPVPITIEWLSKFGFEKDRYRDVFQMPDGDYGFDVCLHKDGLYTARVYSESLVDISCVHQLQNLYFALAGEELNTTE